MSNNDIIVRFHLISGHSYPVKFTKEKWETLLAEIKKNWMQISFTGSEFGINFAHVQYYEVESE